MGTTRRRRLQRHAIEAWRERARRLKLGADRLYLLGRDPRVPWYARVMALGIAAYVLSPIDLIPDFIPVLGHLDDLVLVPLLVVLAIRMIPPGVLAECQQSAEARLVQGQGIGWIGAGLVVVSWLALAALVALLTVQAFH
uniref:DUF1232 domain-containing protein n=1 Tax=Thermorudis sp. TaxID=1969470 RepID=A0A7C3AMK0_9BACT